MGDINRPIKDEIHANTFYRNGISTKTEIMDVRGINNPYDIKLLDMRCQGKDHTAILLYRKNRVLRIAKIKTLINMMLILKNNKRRKKRLKVEYIDNINYLDGKANTFSTVGKKISKIKKRKRKCKGKYFIDPDKQPILDLERINEEVEKK